MTQDGRPPALVDLVGPPILSRRRLALKYGADVSMPG